MSTPKVAYASNISDISTRYLCVLVPCQLNAPLLSGAAVVDVWCWGMSCYQQGLSTVRAHDSPWSTPHC